MQSCDDQKRNLCEEEEEYYQNQHQGGVAGISSTLLPVAGIQAGIGEEGEKVKREESQINTLYYSSWNHIHCSNCETHFV